MLQESAARCAWPQNWGLARSFKREVHNQAIQPGKHGAKFWANILETFSLPVIELMTAPIVTPAKRSWSLFQKSFLYPWNFF